MDFDNFFTSLPLLSALSENATGGTGIIRDNGLVKCRATQASILKKEVRDSFYFQANTDIFVLRWHDNNIVTFAIDCHSLLPIQKVGRVGSVNEKRKNSGRLPLSCTEI